MQKKKWEKPELIVLVRGKPDEAILLACKWGFYGGAGSQDDRCQISWFFCPTGRCETSTPS